MRRVNITVFVHPAQRTGASSARQSRRTAKTWFTDSAGGAQQPALNDTDVHERVIESRIIGPSVEAGGLNTCDVRALGNVVRAQHIPHTADGVDKP